MVRSRLHSPLFLVVLAACAASDTEEPATDLEAASRALPFTDATTTALPNQLCTGTSRGCYTNYAITTDLDGDGLLDLVMANGGGHFVAQSPEPQAVYFGDGRGHFDDARSAFAGGLADSIVRQVAVADFDGDGRLDVYLPGGYGTTADQLWFQHATRAFQNEPARLAGGLRSRAGAVHAGDLDGDGDIDLAVADWGASPNPDSSTPASPVTLRLYVNDGRGNFSAGAALPAPEGSSATDIDVADIDGDFDLDIVLTNRNGQSRLFANDGKGTFTDVTRALAFPRKRGPFAFNAELCDIDGDGDLDLLYDSAARSLAGHSSQVLVNDGSGRFLDDTEARVIGEARSDDNQLKCADIDNDGDYDLVVASLSNPTEKLLRNDGTGHFTNVNGIFPRAADPTLAIDLGDFDGDGRLDLFTANGEVPHQSWLERIYLNSRGTADTAAPKLRAVEHPTAIPGHATVVRLAVLDANTSETGQHVKSVSLDVTVGGITTTVPARFIGGDLFRAAIPPVRAGATMTVVPRATDRAGNEARGEAFDVAMPLPPSTH
ncbi:MAG: VCBS repeat-containing protein [Labilithrix sp.]